MKVPWTRENTLRWTENTETKAERDRNKIQKQKGKDNIPINFFLPVR